MPLAPTRINESFEALQQLFKEVRPTVLAGAGKARHQRKPDGTPVTDVDTDVEDIITERLTDQFPGIVVFGEETGYDDNLEGDFWLLDPIDGTKSFLRNVPAYTGMAVFVQDGEATRSIIYNYHDDDMFSASLGQGAFKNGKRLDLGWR